MAVGISEINFYACKPQNLISNKYARILSCLFCLVSSRVGESHCFSLTVYVRKSYPACKVRVILPAEARQLPKRDEFRCSCKRLVELFEETSKRLAI